MKTYHAISAMSDSDTDLVLCGKPARGLLVQRRVIEYRGFVEQGNSAAWGGRDGRRCRTCLRTARVALGLR